MHKTYKNCISLSERHLSHCHKIIVQVKNQDILKKNLLDYTLSNIIPINLTDEVCILFIVPKCLDHKISYTELVALNICSTAKERLVKIMNRLVQEM